MKKTDRILLEKIKKLMIENWDGSWEEKCRYCGEGEGSKHNEGVHLINSILEGEIKI